MKLYRECPPSMLTTGVAPAESDKYYVYIANANANIFVMAVRDVFQ